MNNSGHHTRFITESIKFQKENRDCLIFKLLNFIIRCSDDELGFVIRKIYCMSIPGAITVKQESFFKTYFGIFGLPLALIGKKLLWKTQNKVDYNIEICDRDYFRTRFEKICKGLSGNIRLTPRLTADAPPNYSVSEPSNSSIAIGTLLRFLLILPLVILPLYWFCWTRKINILQAYRGTITMYLVFDGYFKRYPCKHLITFEDDLNHPSRYIAFKQNCFGKLIVFQNGNRNYYPIWANGMTDVYFVFGEHYRKLIEDMGYFAPSIQPVGSIALNNYYDTVSKGENAYDILYIDNGTIEGFELYGAKSDIAMSEGLIFKHLNLFLQKNRHLRFAYQLRPYIGQEEMKARIVKKVQTFFDTDVEFIENTGQGESYYNIAKATLIITFQSTMGFEALIMGKKTLFINYSGYEVEDLCSDKQFQLSGTNITYEIFEQKMWQLLNQPLGKVPLVAIDRQYAFDGDVHSRIFQTLNEMGSVNAF